MTTEHRQGVVSAWRRWLVRGARAVVLAVMVFCPMAFGTSEVWSMTLAQVLIFSAALLYLVALLPSGPASTMYQTPGILPLALLGALVLMQLLPLPPSILKVLSPGTAQVYAGTIWQLAPDSWMPLTLHYANTLGELFRYGTCFVLYVLSVQLLSQRKFLQRMPIVLAALAGSIAFLAILQKFSAPDKLYWFRQVEGGSVTGPWVYRNHFAGYMELLLPLVLALFLYSRPCVQYHLPWRQRVVEFFTLPEFNQHIFYGLAAILMALSVFVSLSRGGIISMSLSLIVCIFMVSGQAGMSASRIWGCVVGLLILLGVSWLGWHPIMERFGGMIHAQGGLELNRLLIWRDAVGILRDFPIWGAGFGSFIDVFRPYRTIPGSLVYDHAHNDYLELLTDGGLLAGLLVLWFFIQLFRSVFRVLKTRQDRYCVHVALGSFAGLVALLIHSFSDFNLHNGANTFAFFFLSALMVAAAHSSRRDPGRSSLLPLAQGKTILLVAVPVLALMLCGSFWYHKGLLQGERIQRELNKVYLNTRMGEERLKSAMDKADAAVASAPFVARNYFGRANILVFQKKMDEAMVAFARAIALRPLDCLFLQRAAYYMTARQPEQAAQIYQAASRLNPVKVECQQGHARWLLQQGRRPEGLEMLGRALALDSSAEQIAMVLSYRPSLEELFALLPPRLEPHLRFARHYWERREQDKALVLYWRGLEFLAAERSVSPHVFLTGYHWLRQRKQDDEAMALLRRGVELLPQVPEFHILLGEAYLKDGIRYRAEEEYAKAQALRPNDEVIRKKLRVIREQ